MRICLTIDLTGLPKGLSQEIAQDYVRNSLAAAGEKLVSGFRRAKCSVAVDGVVTDEMRSTPKVRAARKPKSGSPAAETKSDHSQISESGGWDV